MGVHILDMPPYVLAPTVLWVLAWDTVSNTALDIGGCANTLHDLL